VPTLDAWQSIGIVCGALLAVLTLIGLLYTKAVRPMFRGLKRLGLMADLFLGDRTKGLPSLPDQVNALRSELRAHVDTWHAPPPGGTDVPSRNGPVPTRQPGRHQR
jgi:hypothetical protein